MGSPLAWRKFFNSKSADQSNPKRLQNIITIIWENPPSESKMIVELSTVHSASELQTQIRKLEEK